MSVPSSIANITSLHCKDQPVNVVYGDNRSARCKLQETLIRSEEKIRSYKYLRTKIILNYVTNSASLNQ